MTGGEATSCKACGEPISTTVRRNTVRCRSCKTPNYIPKSAPTTAEVVQLRPGDKATEWNLAPSSVIDSEEADEDCPDCGEPLVWSAGRTLHYCKTCEEPVFPAALLRPADEQDPRRMPTQRERDLAAIALAQRKGLMITQLNTLAGDNRIDPASLPIIDWFRDEVSATGAAGRLDELAELLAEAGIQRLRWWQRRPALEAHRDDDQDDDGYDQDDEEYDTEDYDDGSYAGPAVRAITPAIDHAAVIRANGFYDVDPGAPAGQCQVIALRSGSTGRVNEVPQPCGGSGFHQLGPYRLCPGHHEQFTR